MMTDMTGFATLFQSNFEEIIPQIATTMLPIIIMGIFLIFGTYIYMSLTIYTTAKKMNIDNAWMAWIPILNLALQAKMAKMSWLPLLGILFVWNPILLIIIGIGIQVCVIIWLWKICEARGKKGWFSIFTLIPFVGSIWNLALWGLLAWDDPIEKTTAIKKKKVVKRKTPKRKSIKKVTKKKVVKKK